MAPDLGSGPVDSEARVPHEQRLQALATRYALASSAANKLERLFRLLVEDPRAPTSVRSPGKVLDDHLADSLVGLELEEVRSAGQLADLGSGAGLPGLPLSIALPQARFVLVESSMRKCQFLRVASRQLELANVDVVHTRAEQWREGAGRFDLVSARALASLPVVLEYAAPLLRLGGTLVAWRGGRDREGEAAAERAAAELGLEPQGVLRVQPYPAARQRYLHLMLKVMETPPRFPRRAGMALKRPLGGGSDRARR